MITILILDVPNFSSKLQWVGIVRFTTFWRSKFDAANLAQDFSAQHNQHRSKSAQKKMN